MPRYIEYGPEKLADAAKSFHKHISKDCSKAVVEDGSKIRNVIEKIEDLAYALVNDGINPQDGTYMTPKDIDTGIKTLQDFGVGPSGILTQQVITRGIEQLPQIDSIFQLFTTKMPYKTGTQVIIPYIGETGGARDVGPSQEYPILSMDRDAEIIANCGKSGISIQLPEETMRNANYPIFSLYLSKAKDSLARWKDNKAVRHVLTKATVLMDNLEPQGAVFATQYPETVGGDTYVGGRTSGRSMKTGSRNGTFTLNDLFKMYMYGIQKGYVYDTILISPWGYLMFMYDPVLRRFIEMNGGVLFTGPNGSTGKNRNEIAKQSRESDMGNFNKLTFDIPKGLIGVGFKIIVTPYIPTYQRGQVIYKFLNYDYTSQKIAYLSGGSPVTANDPVTDLVMLDSGNCLLYLEEEGVTSDTIEDKMYEVTTVKMRERYKFAELEKGRAMVSCRNISITDDTFDAKHWVYPNLTEMQGVLAKA